MAKLTNNQSASKYYSSRQENYIAKLLGGKVTAASGARWDKGDILLPNWLIEAKTSMKPKSSFSIKKEWIEKNELERLEMHKPNSALVFQFEPDGENYFVLSEKTFKKLLDKFEEE